MKILIVDDEFDFCRLIILMLKREQYHIECASSLKDAYYRIRSEHFEVVILDNNLPDGLGIQFLRENPNLFQNTHTIVVSADPSPQVKEIANNSGAEYLAKPFGIKRLKDLIKKAA